MPNLSDRVRRNALCTLIVAAFLCLSAASAEAQVTLDRFAPGVSPSDNFVLDRPTPPGHMRLGVLAYLEYAKDPVIWESVLADDNTATSSIVSDQFAVHPVVSFGLYNRVLAFVDLPINLVMAGDESARELTDIAVNDGTSLGTMNIGGRLHILGKAESLFGLAAQAKVGLPVAEIFGADTTFGAEDSVTFHTEAIAEIRLGRVSFTGNLGLRLRDEVRMYNLDLENEVTFALGGRYAIMRGDLGLDAIVEMFGSSLLDGFGNRESTPTEGLAGLKLGDRDGFLAGIAGDMGMTHGYGSPFYRIIGLIGYAPAGSSDKDLDGIEDDTDGCPARPEDVDSYRDTDGCPELDNDEDGIPDSTDKCATDPEDKDDFEDKDGCPDPDNDHDGLLDGADACPNEAEDKDGFEDKDGCPDTDNDKDGVLDADDQCPDEVEDKDGFQDSDGCPEADNDKDGIADGNDQCPLEAETINDIDDEDGCPDLIRVDRQAAQIYTLKPIRFATNKTQILPDSLDMLREIAGVLKTHEEISSLSIEGHTDSKGNASKNLSLSVGRANSVREFLIQNGVEAQRLVANGFGSEQPIANNASADGRAKNRRVEFNIVGVKE